MKLSCDSMVRKCLEDVLKVEKYLEIRKDIKRSDFTVTESFRKKYKSFYNIRFVSQEWSDKYFALLEEQVKGSKRSFEELLKKLYDVSKRVDVSFASKIIATVSPDEPIWDKYVLMNMGFEKRWDSFSDKYYEERIKEAVNIYNDIKAKYVDILNSEEGRKCIERFDELLPQYKDNEELSDIKKIDYVIWSYRE